MSKEEMIKVIYEKIWVDYLMDDWLAWIKTYHPVMIWDVLDWIKTNLKEKTYYTTIEYWEKQKYFRQWLCARMAVSKDLRTQPRLPIEDQSEECISFIYNLCKDE